MRFEVRLVHAEAGCRVVEVRALAAEGCLGSALGEAADAEEAEERALRRLRRRLQDPPEHSTAVAAPDGSERQPADAAGAQPGGAPPQASGSLPAEEHVAASAAAKPRPQPGAQAMAAAGPDARKSAAAAAGPLTASGEVVSAAADGAAAAPGREPLEEAPADPEDWSLELARLDLALRRIGWDRDREGVYLQRAFGHPSRSRITQYGDLLAYVRSLEALESGADPVIAPVPLRRRDLLAQSDDLLGQLGWDGGRARTFTEERLGVRSRSQLGDTDLLQLNMLLEAELIGAPSADAGPEVAAGGNSPAGQAPA